MTNVLVAKSISAPPERVFALATDLRRAAERISGIDSVEILSHGPSADGPFGVGTRWRETRTMMGKQATEEMTVFAFKPGRSYMCEAHSNGCHYVSGLTCVPDGNGTRVLLHFIARPETTAARMMLTLMFPINWMMTRMVRKCFEADLDDLRRAAEAD